MKKALVCLAGPVLLALVIVIARWITGSGALTAEDAAVIAVEALHQQLVIWGTSLPYDPRLEAVLEWIFRPGAYLLTRIGCIPRGQSALVVAFVASWWIWAAGARLAMQTVGRFFGVTSMATLVLWVWLVPPWRPFYKVWRAFRRWCRQFIYGRRATAHWTGALEAMTIPYRRRDSVFVGRLWAHGFKLLQPLGIRGPRHIVVVAGSGAGKTRWMMGWLGMLPKKASAFVVDCDGQIVNALGPGLDRAGHKVLVLDPFSQARYPGACWNALDELTAAEKRHGRKAVVRFAGTLADALIQENNSNQPIFAQTARNFVHGLTLYVWAFEPKAQRHLIRLRELLTRGMPELALDPKQDTFDLLLRHMEDTVSLDDRADGAIVAVIARAASAMRSGKGRDGNPFRTTAITQTAWLDLPELAAISKRSDFVGEDLKTGNPCLFVCAPVTDIQSKLAGWVRALTMMTMYAFQSMPGGRRVPCAFCIDEMPSLGHMEILETAAPVFRKYGIRLVVITQDLERLKQAYPKSYGGFLGNAQAILWMGSDHQDTLEELSRILGSATVTEEFDGGWFSKVPPRIERREQPLMRPDQLREFLDPERKQIIVTRTGKPPLKVSYEGYDKALAVWQYEPDPNHREPIGRALARLLLRPVL